MKIKVCTGKTCMDKFSNYIIDRLNNDKKKFNLNHIDIEESKCMGHCKKGPNIKIDKNIHNYCNPLKASKIILNTKKKKK